MNHTIQIESSSKSSCDFQSSFHELFLTLFYDFSVYVFMLFWILLNKTFLFHWIKNLCWTWPLIYKHCTDSYYLSAGTIYSLFNYIEEIFLWVFPLHYWITLHYRSFIYFSLRNTYIINISDAKSEYIKLIQVLSYETCDLMIKPLHPSKVSWEFFLLHA